MLLLIFSLCVVQSFAFRFGFLIEDNAGKFLGCSVAQFGIISETANNKDRYHVTNAINHFLRAMWKSKFAKNRDPGFKSVLKPIPNPSSNTAFLALSIEGEMNIYLAQIKINVFSQLDPPEYWDLVTFFKSPILFCPVPVAEALLSEPEINIKLVKAAVERPNFSNDAVSVSMIDLDSNFEVPTYYSDTATNTEGISILSKKRFPCCTSCNLL